ncbi:MAG: TIGR03667 family PPOX class F420-dependent oxidoreductase [Chloroflexi bacterium]|nr:MAG: TIGR03667 family PPOX class F420-dependent oxidoreductase [Chloroflexota bacterium]
MASRQVESRLRKELVIWFVTAGRDGRPQAVPVWFLYEDDSFLIYSAPGVKARHVRENPNVELHLNTDELGEVVVRASGQAKISRSEPPAHKKPAYVRKYRDQIKGFGWTPEVFAEKYPHAVRVRKLRFH